MFLDRDQMYLRMCNVNKEKTIFWNIRVVLFTLHRILTYAFIHRIHSHPANFYRGNSATMLSRSHEFSQMQNFPNSPDSRFRQNSDPL